MSDWVLWLVSAALGFVVGSSLFLVRLFRQRDASADAEMQRLLSLMDGVAEGYLRESRRAEEFLAKIDEVIEEREAWRTLYNDQAAGHDNAQALMMRTIESLLRAYQKKVGEPPKLDPLIETVRRDWAEEHGQVAREERQEDGRRDSAEKKPE